MGACPMQADICQLGLDQRKVNVLAREYCDQCKPKRKLKPVILSHEMMPGLLQVCLPMLDLNAFSCSSPATVQQVPCKPNALSLAWLLLRSPFAHSIAAEPCVSEINDYRSLKGLVWVLGESV